MKASIFKLAVAASVAIGTGAVGAQEFGDGKSTTEASASVVENTSSTILQGEAPFEQKLDGAIAADQMVAEEPVPEVPKSAKEQISMYVEDKGYQIGTYDEAKDRIVVLESIKFDISNPEVSSDYLNLRTEKMSELLLNAKAEIIKTIYSSMSAERILEIPENPIAKQVAEEKGNIEKRIEASRKQLEKLGVDLDEAATNKKGMTMSELMASISAWFVKSDKENVAAKYDADKKEVYANAKVEFERAKEEYEGMLEKVETARGQITKQLTSKIVLVSSLQIHGCTVLQQADSVSNKNGKYQYEICILYSWSGERMAASQCVLAAKPLKLKPGKNTVQKWLAKKRTSGALSDWIGPRSYIDKNGDLWFMGIALAPCSDNADQEEQNLKIARLEARAEVGYSIYADAATYQGVNKLMQGKDRKNIGFADQYSIYKAYHEHSMERFNDLNLYGLGKLGEYRVKDATGQDVYAVIYGINASTAKAMRNIRDKMHVAGLEINSLQEFERGRIQRMDQQIKASRNNAAVRTAGARNVDTMSRDAATKKRAVSVRKAGSDMKSTSAPSEPAKTKGRLQTGTRFVADEDDE